MFINVLEPFWTPEDEKRLKKLQQDREDAVTAVLTASETLGKAHESKDADKAQAAFESLKEVWERYNSAEQAFHRHEREVEQRYYESFKGDLDAIIADAKRIIDAATKDEYKEALAYWADLYKSGQDELDKEREDIKTIFKNSKFQRYAKEQSTRGYNTFYTFLEARVRLQRTALHFYNADNRLPEIYALIDAKASSVYHKPKTARKSPAEGEQQTESFLELPQEAYWTPEQRAKHPYYNLPATEAGHLMITAMEAGEHLPELPERMTQISKGYKYSYRSEPGLEDNALNTLTKTKTTRSGTEEIEVTISVYPGKNTNPLKLFLLSLAKINEQSFFGGELQRDYITFPLTELINNGMYTTIQSARQGFKNMRRGLLSIQVGGTIGKRQGKKQVDYDLRKVMFTDADIVNGQCVIRLNPRLNWEGIVATAYTYPPEYALSLPSKSLSLLYYIYYLARQNTDKLEKDGYFTISMRAIQHRLLLPNEDDTKNPGRDIKDQIDTALTEIEETHSAKLGNKDLSIIACKKSGQPLDMSRYTPIKEFLDDCYLRVQISGELIKPFLEIQEAKRKRIATAEKRKQKIIDEAKTRNMQKALDKAGKGEEA